MAIRLPIAVLTLALLALPAAADTPAAPGAGKARSDFILYCAGCHGMSGQGTLEGGVPAFPNSIQHIASTDMGRSYIMHVPGVVSNELPDDGIADVMNYILDHWGDGTDHFTADEVTRRRAIPIGDVVTYRRKVVAELRDKGIELADYPWP